MTKYILITFFLLFSCTRSPIKDPSKAMYPVPTPEVFTDDLELDEYMKALKINLNVLKKQMDRNLQFGKTKIPAREYATSLEKLVDFYEKNPIKEKVLQYIRENFEWQEVYGRERPGQIMLTSYYEPLYDGRLKPSKPYIQPIYKLPNDLVEVDTKSFSKLAGFQSHRRRVGARLVQRENSPPKIIPFYSRNEIDQKKVLKGKNLELFYLDPIHSFFLQIQGSGIIKLPNGKLRRVGYAGQNGHKYESIGKHLYHVIPKEEMSLQRIEAHLRSLNQEDLYDFLDINASYVFFRELEKGRGRTTFGTEVVSGRTIAVDSSLFPLGAIGHLIFQKPVFENKLSSKPIDFESTSRLIIAQDTGGAIKTAGRADLFWGEGSSALQYAGVMKHDARLWFLIPKN